MSGGLAPAIAADIDDIQRRIDALETEVQRLKVDLAVQKETARAREAKRANEPAFKVSTKGGLKIESTDGDFKFRIGGRLMADSAWYDQDRSQLGDGTELRRARVSLSGTLFEDWDFETEYDFAGDDVSIKDALLEYNGFEPMSLTVGNFKAPFSLEELTSSRYITFMERSLPNAFAPGRRLGLGGRTHGENWTAALGVFGSEVGGDAAGEGDEGWDATARLTYAPLSDETLAAHLGAAVRYNDPADETTRFRARPESHVTDVRFVNTGTIADVADTVSWGSELAFVYGPFSLQGEYVRTLVQRNTGTDLAFDGWYAYVSYFMTGESRAYNAKKGRFGRVKPHRSLGDGGFGAVELAARYSAIDLDDDDVTGGGESNFTLGLNWHLNPSVRFMANYIWVDNDANAQGNAANLLAGVADAGDDDPNVFQIRAQFDF